MYMAIPLCTNFCMYKRINKNCATFLIKKETKIICIIFYLILNYICQLCLFLFSTIKKRQLWLRYYLFVNIIQRNVDVFFVAYSKLCVSVICVLVFDLLYKPGTSERAILLCTPISSSLIFFVSRLTRVSVWEFMCSNVDGLVY